MKKTAISALCCGTLTACLGQATEEGDLTPWEEAIALLNTGKVTTARQTHDLEVRLSLDDGRWVKTIEPRIDAIFDEVKKCGEKCAGTALMTE